MAFYFQVGEKKCSFKQSSFVSLNDNLTFKFLHDRSKNVMIQSLHLYFQNRIYIMLLSETWITEYQANIPWFLADPNLEEEQATRVTLCKQGHKRWPEKDKVRSQGDEGSILSERPLAPSMEAKLKAACSVWIAFSSAFIYCARWKP